jgi:CRISPR-associated protein Cas8a1/Csx13
MGYVGYYQGQSIRKSVLNVPPALLPVRRYRLVNRELSNAYVALKIESNSDGTAVTKKGAKGRGKKSDGSTLKGDNAPSATGFIKLPAVRGRISDNLVTGRPWYSDLFTPLIWNLDEAERERKRLGTSLERAWFQAICYQRSKLMKLIAEDDMWDTEAEKVFVNAFWEAMDSLYAQEGKATERGGSRTPEDRFEDLNDDLRRRITQAKTRPLLRSVLADILAKAGDKGQFAPILPLCGV